MSFSSSPPELIFENEEFEMNGDIERRYSIDGFGGKPCGWLHIRQNTSPDKMPHTLPDCMISIISSNASIEVASPEATAGSS
jgi:hypothetical protein